MDVGTRSVCAYVCCVLRYEIVKRKVCARMCTRRWCAHKWASLSMMQREDVGEEASQGGRFACP